MNSNSENERPWLPKNYGRKKFAALLIVFGLLAD